MKNFDTQSGVPAGDLPEVGASALAKARRRILPLLFVVYVIAYIDRVNISFAASTMNVDLGISQTAYGLGAGIFFIGYFVVEIPSNLALERFGARLWITRIMITWGLLSAAMMFVWDGTSFNVMRFLVGVAEAGLFPGVILYLTYWFPPESRTRAVAAFMVAIPIAGVIGSPLSGLLLGFGHGLFGLAGWQVMYLVEGLAAVALAFVVLFALPDRPRKATWLTDEEKDSIEASLAHEERAKAARTGHRAGFLQIIGNGRVWGFTACYFLLSAAIYGITLWLGVILASTSDSGPVVLGLLGAIPYVVAAIVMLLWAAHADRAGERRWHCIIGTVVTAAGFALTGVGQGSLTYQIIALSIAAAGILSALVTFWALPTAYLTAAMAAVAIAVINSVGNLGGFLGPYAIGVIHDVAGSYYPAMLLLAACALLGGLGLAYLSRGTRAPHAAPEGQR